MTVTPHGSTVLVTGADGGLGAEFVYQALDLDAKVYSTDRTPPSIERKPSCRSFT
jgi:NAD(P)-dependent dehydrogenase (short-subunit alcohol dehydrogenase family)